MILFIVLLFLNLGNPELDSDVKAQNYIETYKDIAIIEMHRTGIPASITIAQALHESNLGYSDLAIQAKNHFGIKCKRYWKGHTYYHVDDDKNDQGQLIESCFRSYDNVLDSYIDHSNFLKSGAHYQSLFTFSKENYVAWAYGLKQAGYATDKRYAEKLIMLIERYNLTELDKANDPFLALKNKNILNKSE